MSYNIDSSEYVSGSLQIKRADAVAFVKHFGDRGLPECNFLEDLPLDGDPDELLPIKEPEWRGEFSGHSFDTLQEVLKKTTGKASILFVWEGGDSKSALVVEDGKVREGKVVISVK